MPQHLLDDVRMHALTQEQRGAGVPEVVELDRLEPRLFEEWIEGAVDDTPSVARNTLALGEDEL